MSAIVLKHSSPHAATMIFANFWGVTLATRKQTQISIKFILVNGVTKKSPFLCPGFLTNCIH